jgi:hypothetical protein
MNLCWKYLPYSIALLGFVAATAEAGSMNTLLTVSARFDNATNFNPLPFTFAPSGAVANGQPGVYQVDISFTATKVAGEKGWANTLFDLAAGPNAGGSNLGLNFLVGWQGLPNPSIDINGSAPGGIVPIYATNEDAGAPGDLKAIIVSIGGSSNDPSDPRNQLGTPQAPPEVGYPSLLGSFFVDWNGLGQGSVLVQNQQFSFTHLDNTFGQTQNGAGATALFGVPEPATLTLAGLALLGLIGFARRRQQSGRN